MQGVLKHFRKKNNNEPTRIIVRFCVRAALFDSQQLKEILHNHIITRVVRRRSSAVGKKKTNEI